MGLGRRTFAPGEVLTASNVMNYLMDQSVMNFAGTAARGSAIGTAVQQGMVTYLNNTNTLEAYNGTAWTNILTNASSLGASGSNGYMRLSNGLIFQWGITSGVQNTNCLFTFPIAFPTALLSVQAIVSASATFSPGNKGTSNDTYSLTQAGFAHDIPANTNIRVFAIGY